MNWFRGAFEVVAKPGLDWFSRFSFLRSGSGYATLAALVAAAKRWPVLSFAATLTGLQTLPPIWQNQRWLISEMKQLGQISAMQCDGNNAKVDFKVLVAQTEWFVWSRSKMKLRSLLSLEGVGLESNRSSALTEYGCEQVVPLSITFCFSL